MGVINAKKMWDYFKSQGLNDYGIAGLMGNLYYESGLKSTNLQNSYEKSLGYSDDSYTKAVDDGTYTNFVKDAAGYGLAQWTYWSLKQELLDYHKKKGKSIGDEDTQMEFLCHQLSTSYKSVWTTLKTATSVLEASNAVLLKFERPADQSVAMQNKRAAAGQKYYDEYAIKIEIPKEGGNGKMKYSNSNKPLVCMQTQSTCYKGTSKMTVKGVLWHSTGANNKTIKRYVQPSDDAADRDAMLEIIGVNQYKNDWNHINQQAGLNAWIGTLANGTVATVQTMPWDYKPWGCGSGPKGSCNNGWIQFEICEDALTDKVYFEQAYKEACELTAYLCDMFDLDPNGTVDYNGVKVPVILCHADSNKLGLGSNHGDVDHWFPKYGKSMETAREDVAKLMGKVAPATQSLYRVRKSWADSASQKGAFADLNNAKKLVDQLGNGYFVFDEAGKVIYPEVKKPEPTLAPAPKPVTPTSNFKVGETVKLTANATYSSGATIPQWVKNSTLYVRQINSNGDIVFSTLKTGAITGTTKPNYLVKANAPQTNQNPNVIANGDVVYLTEDAKFSNGQSIQKWVFGTKLYARQVRDNGDVIISTQQTGAITGVVNKKYLTKKIVPVEQKVQVTASSLRLREGPGTNYKAIGLLNRYTTVVIKETKNGWGKTDKGWIFLEYTKKV